MRRALLLLLAALAVAGCRSHVEVVDRDKADVIPREAALAYLRELDALGALSLTPTPEGLVRKGRKSDGVAVPWSEWTLRGGRITRVVTEATSSVWIEREGKGVMFFGERTPRHKEFEALRRRIKKILTALAALGVREPQP